MGCGGSSAAPAERREDDREARKSKARYEVEEGGKSEGPAEESPAPQLTVSITGAADAGGSAEVSFSGVPSGKVCIVGVFHAADANHKAAAASQTIQDQAQGALRFELGPLGLAPGERCELRLCELPRDAAQEPVLLARCPMTLAWERQRPRADSPDRSPSAGEARRSGSAKDEQDRSRSRGSHEPPASPGQRTPGKRASQSTVSTYATAATGLTIGSDDEDADELVMRYVQRLREQALAECRSAGSLSGLRINGMNPARIGAPRELGSRDLARIRRWADMLPPFDPIPAVEDFGETGRAPRAHMLQSNQELLDALLQDRGKALSLAEQRGLVQARGQGDGPPPLSPGVPSQPWDNGAASLSVQGRGSALDVSGSEPSQRHRVKASSAMSPPNSPPG